MAARQTWVEIGTLASTVRTDNSPSTSLALDWGLVPVHPISLTLLRSRGQSKFIYSYLPPPSEVPFKDKTVTELKHSKADNTSGTRWLFLTMATGRTWVGIETLTL
ncbi:hypothetical protein DEO72_LG10g3284 [Vigna unguiculata]|uniref:Uncharacterized protein n=1 Tax=Vigna unguiculata TaxID=3917 RepID=A0A4D6NH86_VIGUN|nr:hypothetical protein DEO72_LG10g3284 [Vigna unguiculata]